MSNSDLLLCVLAGLGTAPLDLLAVRCWQRHHRDFGLGTFWEEHPDNAKVCSLAVRLVQRGLAFRPSPGHYRLTAEGRRQAAVLAKCGD